MRYAEITYQAEAEKALDPVDHIRRAALPFVVDCIGLTPLNLSDREFEKELHRRKAWCATHAEDWEIVPLGMTPEHVIGRRFRFARDHDAAMFKKWFAVRL